MEVGLQSNFKLSENIFTIFDLSGNMKINGLNNLLGFMIFFLFIASCFNEDSLINSVDDTEVILVVNDEGVTSKTFKKVFNKQKKIFRFQDTQDIKPEELIWIKNRFLQKKDYYQ